MIKKLLIILGLKKTFTTRISKSLSVFSVAKEELIKINTEMVAETLKNNKQIDKLSIENSKHESAWKENANIISNINLLLGEK
jgi:hypothetical protein